MAFTTKKWTDRQSEHPARRMLVATGNDNEYDVIRSEGMIVQEGDAFNAETMNDLENRIATGFTQEGDRFLPLSGGTMNGDLSVCGGRIKFLNAPVGDCIVSMQIGNFAAGVVFIREGDQNGFGMGIQTGGLLYLGSGEAASNRMNAEIGTDYASASVEEIVICSDFNIRVETNCQYTPKIMTFTTDGRLSGLSNPTQATDAATKAYVDSAIQTQLNTISASLAAILGV